jgi:hypothetical protein
MRPTRTLFTLLILPLLTSCSAGLVLKSPINSKCESAGLKGCPELTEGALLYVEGKKAEGKEQLLAGAAQNAPAKVKKFAAAIRELRNIPGVADKVKPLMEVADILASAKGGKGGGKGKARKGIGGAAPESVEYDEDAGHAEGGTVSPGNARNRVPCGNMPGYAACVRVATGPLVITDLAVGDGCPTEMIAAAARSADDLMSVHWIVRSPHGLGDERGFVRPGESLFIASQGNGGDPRCSMTWAGFRPGDAQ